MTRDEAALVLQRQGIKQFHIEPQLARNVWGMRGAAIYTPAEDGNLRLAVNKPTLRECVDALLAAQAEEKEQ